MKNCFFLLIFISFSSLLLAQQQQVSFERFTIESRLASPIVRGLMQDREGYLWFGTINAVHRFDGFSFKTFKYEQENKANITKGFVNVIYEDEGGNLWAGTSSGLDKLNRSTGEFQQFVPDPFGPTFKNDMWSIFEDSRGRLWVGSSMALYYLDTSATKLVPFSPQKNKELILNNSFRSIMEDDQGYLWFGSGIGLIKYDRNTDELSPIWIEPEPHLLFNKLWNLGNYGVLCINKDKSGILWAGSFGGTLLKLDPLTGKAEYYMLKNPATSEVYPIQSISEEGDGTLWIGTYSGLLLFDKISGKIMAHYVYDENLEGSLSDTKVTSVLKDRSGALWIGTLQGGLNKLNRTKFAFKNIIRKSWGADKSYSQIPFSDMVVSKSGSLLVGTTTGIEEIKPGLKEIVSYEPNKAVNILMEDAHGNLWIGIKQYSGGGLYKKDIKGNIFPILDSAGKMFTKEIHCLYETKKGRIFFGTEFYLFEIDPQTSIASMIFNTNRRIWEVAEDTDETLWFGTLAGGLIHYDLDHKSVIKNFMPDEKDPNSISDNSITQIYLDKKGVLWVGTSLGLNKYDRATGGFKHYNEKNGLANNTIVKILEDNSGNLWLSTISGISKFDPENEVFKNYDISYGIAEGYEYAGGISKSGEMFLKGRTGITYFYPDSIKDNPFIPPVVITELKVFNKSHSFTDETRLSYAENYISLEFAALSFISPEKNLYAYKMEGVDKDWVYSGNRRYAAYTSLEPGKYIFRVKASNNDGVWNETGTSLSIIILPPWWKTYWAYASYFVIFIFLLYGWRKYDLKRQNLKYQLKLEHESAKKQEEISQMKSRFFTNISHEFRTPLTLIIGPAEKIISNTADLDSQKQANLMKKNALHLLGLVNQLLDISKIDEGKLNLRISRSNIVSFIKGIVMIFESFAESRDIMLSVKSQKREIQIYFDKEKMEKVMINILSNAFKFTPTGGRISVILTDADNNKLVIKVRDTGIGIPANELPKLFDRFYQVDSSHTRERGGTGIGLALAKELVELHHGRISVDSEAGKWTEFTIELPLGGEHLTDNEVSEQEIEPETTFDEAKYSYLTEQIDADLQSAPSFSDDSLIHPHDSRSESAGGEKTIILLVEDNADVREFIKDSLGKEYEVEEAANGEQGVRKAEMIIPDLIIADVMMPKMDGYEMTRILKIDEKTNHIPIILLTAKSDQQSKFEGLGTGADEYIIKPFDTKELKIRIRNLINIRKKLQDKFARGERIPLRRGEKKLSDINEKFMNRVMEIIDKHIAEEEFSIEDFGKELCMSRTQLHRKLKALTGKSASRYVRSFRLSVAREMIKDRKGNISEIAYSVGFSSPVYFSKCFKDEYGCAPSELMAT